MCCAAPAPPKAPTSTAKKLALGIAVPIGTLLLSLGVCVIFYTLSLASQMEHRSQKGHVPSLSRWVACIVASHIAAIIVSHTEHRSLRVQGQSLLRYVACTVSVASHIAAVTTFHMEHSSQGGHATSLLR